VTREADQFNEIAQDKTGPYEQRLLSHADWLKGRIAELRSHEQTLRLNDRPIDKK
jgi:hypothetical protein